MTGRALIAALCFALVLPAAAAKHEDKEPAKLAPAKERAKELTKKMKEKLQLTGDQEDKVKEINLRAAEAVDRAVTVPGAGRYDRYQAVRAAQTQRDNELKGVLTHNQFATYKRLKDELKDTVKAKAELKKKSSS